MSSPGGVHDLASPLASAALDAVENMLVITDRDGAIVYVNDAFTQVTGYAYDDAVGRNPRLLRSGMQDDTFYEQLWATVLAGETWSGELVNRKKSGELYTDRMTITPLHDEDGAIGHFVAVKRDVSGHLAALTAGNPSGIAHIDPSGRLVYANDRLSTMLARPFEGLLGRGWLDALGPNASAQV
ncbi:MAG: PAS domain-containing protein, partial [Nitriliruptoraceae bacterium]